MNRKRKFNPDAGYARKSRAGTHPYMYSPEYMASKGHLDGEERERWMRRFSPARNRNRADYNREGYRSRRRTFGLD